MEPQWLTEFRLPAGPTAPAIREVHLTLPAAGLKDATVADRRGVLELARRRAARETDDRAEAFGKNSARVPREVFAMLSGDNDDINMSPKPQPSGGDEPPGGGTDEPTDPPSAEVIDNPGPDPEPETAA